MAANDGSFIRLADWQSSSAVCAWMGKLSALSMSTALKRRLVAAERWALGKTLLCTRTPAV
jgi:hypothetical protein